jgi:type III restriction enzyme
LSFEVTQPILNSAFEPPERYWYICEAADPVIRDGRRPAMVFQPRDQNTHWDLSDGTLAPLAEYDRGYELKLVTLIRERLNAWRAAGYPGVTRTTLELLEWWRRDGRERRLFFAQVEAAETIIFLAEARADFLQGIDVPRQDVGDGKRAEGYEAFRRHACKMATGSGKTTVMGMLAAWSILNKVNAKTDARFSDVVLIVCPNVTIRDRLQELNPENGEASLYRTRDLVPPHLLPLLARGKVLVTNWHVFEPQAMQTGGVSAKVTKAGVPLRTRETIRIGPKKTVARGTRYLTIDDYQRQVAGGLLDVVEEKHKDGELVAVTVESVRYVESDTALVARVLGRAVGGKQNILVMNDEAHHAYRIRREEPDEDEGDLLGDDEEADEFYKEATVWVDGLDRIHKLRGINFCIDLSATPYYLGRVGQDTARPFPWVVSDFGLIDAIESGLVKIPQLAVRDTTGDEIPGFRNIWRWIATQLTPAERGGKRSSPKPEAIVKYAHTPIAMLGTLWSQETKDWEELRQDDPRPPVFILVCKNTAIAKVLFEWLAEDKCPTGVPAIGIPEFRNKPDRTNTIRVDVKVVHETDTGAAKNDEVRWMRFTLDTVGKVAWPTDSQGRPIYPAGFEELAKKLDRPLHPPGRDIRCIVSVGMLTEGWDANTVTHIVGLRPFMSQLLCEQVVGRGLRRVSYEVGADGLFTEEVATVFGVPFEVIPFKANRAGTPPPPVKRHHVHALPDRAHLEIRFPRVEGYTQAVRNRISIDWSRVPTLKLDPLAIPPEVEVAGLSISNKGRPTLVGTGRLKEVSLQSWRVERRLQMLQFQLARDITSEYLRGGAAAAPAHVLFPQFLEIVQRYTREKIVAESPNDIKDAFLAPYYGWMRERLTESIRPDTDGGETPEIPRYEANRGEGSTAEVDFWTSKEVRPTLKSHVNFMVADTVKWEEAAGYHIDSHSAVTAWVKNAGLGFAIRYVHDAQLHDYVPDFLIRLKDRPDLTLILETKGRPDPLVEVKHAAADRWCQAVTQDGRYGKWHYILCRSVGEVREALDRAERDLG